MKERNDFKDSIILLIVKYITTAIRGVVKVNQRYEMKSLLVMTE